MKILYLGPYKHNTSISLSSLDIIDTLSSDPRVTDLTIRPLFLNDNIIANQNFLISNLENKELSGHDYDVIIQHAPIESLTDVSSLCKKSIAIPLFEKITDKELYSKQLENFTYHLIDSEEYANFLKTNYHIDNVKLFSYNKIYKTNHSINLNQYNNDTKFYWIGSYDSFMFDKLMNAFYLAFHNQNDISLMIFFNQEPASINDDINNKISKLKNNLKILSDNNNINIIIKSFSLEDIIAIHNTCQIYIDLNSSNFESSINRHIAAQNNKKIVTESDIQKVKIPHPKHNVFDEYFESFVTHSISENFSKVLNTNNLQKTTYPTVVDLICQ